MAIFKSKVDPNAAYALPEYLLEAATALTAALDARATFDSAVAKNSTDRQAADEARMTAEAEVERADLELAMCLDDEKTAVLERKLTSARMTAQTSATAFDRTTSRQTGLYKLAPEKDAAVAAARQNFQTAVGTFGREANEALAAEAREAVQHLVRVLARGHAIAASIGSLGQAVGFLGETIVPSPAPSQSPIIGHGKADGTDGSRLDLAAEWRADPTAGALAAIMQPVADLRRRVARHSAFVPPPPATAKPYEVSPANRSAVEHNREIEAREGPWSPRSRHSRHMCTGSATVRTHPALAAVLS
jgi:hypothetical protein